MQENRSLGFRPGLTETDWYCPRRLEARNFGLKKKNCTTCAADLRVYFRLGKMPVFL